MKIGVAFPQMEIGNDPVLIRDFAQAADDLGYHHLMAYEHVVGVDPSSRPGWNAPFTYKTPFHEPLVLFSHLGAVTRRIEFVSGIIILPQRQTILFAKQAAEVDVLSGGRLRLGVAIGWNAVEFETLNEDFHNRGLRIEEQVQVMRLLWTQEVVDFRGRWHHLDHVGINPLPVQRPIPLWLGGMSEVAIKRAARIGDGWYSLFRPSHDARQLIASFQEEVRLAGRQPADVGFQAQVSTADGTPDDWSRQVEEWLRLGATHLCVTFSGATVAERIDEMGRFKDAVSKLGDWR